MPTPQTKLHILEIWPFSVQAALSQGLMSPVMKWRTYHHRTYHDSIIYLEMSLGFKYRRIYEPSIVVDGNFKLDHVITKRAEDDVFLSDGRGFMVGRERFQRHLETAIEPKQVTFLSQIRFIQLMTRSKENAMPQSPCNISSQWPQQKSLTCNRCWGMCMCTSRLFLPS